LHFGLLLPGICQDIGLTTVEGNPTGSPAARPPAAL
jgi:hypothetical protein